MSMWPNMVPSYSNHVALTAKRLTNGIVKAERSKIAHVKLLGWDNFDASFINHFLI